MSSSSHDKRLADIKRFYEIIEQLENNCDGKRLLANCNGYMKWPKRGVYFFYESGEMRTTSVSGMRVVRVGTHALKKGGKNTLWKRLSQHQGTQKTGGGNHRGSVFRLHVGTALINRDKWTDDINVTWAVGSSASREVRQREQPLEHDVSQHIRSMPFLWLKVDDPSGPNSQRKYIERNAIALLSNYCSTENPIDPSGDNWLGKYARSADIQRSGLWNVNHVRECYDPEFLNALDDWMKNDPCGYNE